MASTVAFSTYKGDNSMMAGSRFAPQGLRCCSLLVLVPKPPESGDDGQSLLLGPSEEYSSSSKFDVNAEVF